VDEEPGRGATTGSGARSPGSLLIPVGVALLGVACASAILLITQPPLLALLPIVAGWVGAVFAYRRLR
jgi:hypothetical protein